MLWGTAGVAGRLAGAAGSVPLVTAAARTIVAAVVLAPVVAALRVPALPGRRGARIGVVGVGALLAVYQTAYFAAVEQAGVTVATLVALGVAPVVVAVASPLIGDPRPDALTWAAIAIAVGGLALLVVGGGDAAPEGGGTLVGVGLALVCAFGFAGVNLLGRTLYDVAPLRLLVVAFTIGGALQALPLIGGIAPVAPSGLAVLLYLGIVPTAVAYVLFFRGIVAVRAPIAAVTTLLEPVTAAVLAAIVFGERFSAVGWVGGVLLVVAMGMTGRRGTSEPATVVAATDDRPGR